MQYKQTKLQNGLIYLGMEFKWETTKKGVNFVTGMHFRDAVYPIEIRRYPGSGSMITDSQRMGVVTGEFIRAQQLCEPSKQQCRMCAWQQCAVDISDMNQTKCGASFQSNGGKPKRCGGEN